MKIDLPVYSGKSIIIHTLGPVYTSIYLYNFLSYTYSTLYSSSDTQIIQNTTIIFARREKAVQDLLFRQHRNVQVWITIPAVYTKKVVEKEQLQRLFAPQSRLSPSPFFPSISRKTNNREREREQRKFIYKA